MRTSSLEGSTAQYLGDEKVRGDYLWLLKNNFRLYGTECIYECSVYGWCGLWNFYVRIT